MGETGSTDGGWSWYTGPGPGGSETSISVPDALIAEAEARLEAELRHLRELVGNCCGICGQRLWFHPSPGLLPAEDPHAEPAPGWSYYYDTEVPNPDLLLYFLDHHYQVSASRWADVHEGMQGGRRHAIESEMTR